MKPWLLTDDLEQGKFKLNGRLGDYYNRASIHGTRLWEESEVYFRDPGKCCGYDTIRDLPLTYI